MSASSHSFLTKRTARYFMLGQATAEVTDLWICLHGYGQLAEYFIRHFQGLADERTLIVAPEALSRFYLGNEFKRIGASWMTREARLEEIGDQLIYLDSLLEQFKSQLSHPALKVRVLGFSQGVATSWRWLKEGKSEVDSLTLWAGRVPREMDKNWHMRLAKMELNVVYGNQDPFITEQLIKAEDDYLLPQFPDLRKFNFEGKHELHEETLIRIKEMA